MINWAFDIRPGEVDLPTFPPFALFDPAMGMTTVIPLMDPTRPARVDPETLVRTVQRFNVTNIFGSPALLNVLGRYTATGNIHLPSVRRVISAGAAMPVATVRRLQKTLSSEAEIHTPYGATECLPVASVSGTELDQAVEERTSCGEGTCIGKPVAPNDVKIIPVNDGIIETFEQTVELPVGITGEIVVHGPTSTDSYWLRSEQTRLSKIVDSKDRVWHRMGDAGYFDTDGRLWYCGRKSQRVICEDRVMYADQVEAIFNIHPEVARSALVGIGKPGSQTPVLCVEPLSKPNRKRRERIRNDLRQIGRNNTLGALIRNPQAHVPTFTDN